MSAENLVVHYTATVRLVARPEVYRIHFVRKFLIPPPRFARDQIPPRLDKNVSRDFLGSLFFGPRTIGAKRFELSRKEEKKKNTNTSYDSKFLKSKEILFQTGRSHPFSRDSIDI